MKTYEQINDRISEGKAVVMTAEEIIDYVDQKGLEAAAEEVDVVTTATFGPMCSSGCVLNFGHSTPKIRMSEAWIEDVLVYSGLAAVDVYLGATQLRHADPANMYYPGEFRYGGGHVIEDLIAGKRLQLFALSYGTDEYPLRELRTYFTIDDLNQAIMVNPRNCYQNYNVAINESGRRIHTYMGSLEPNCKNANYCSAGQLSPLLNDPCYRTIGVGTRIFLGGGAGYDYFRGTQHAPDVKRTDGGVPTGGAGTLAVTGDLKGMRPEYLRAASITGYGVSLAVGIGVPIPILDEEIARHTAVRDSEILAPVIDYSDDYPNNRPEPLAHVSYAELRSGTIEVLGKRVRTAGLSSYDKARSIATELKGWIEAGEFLVGRPADPLPGPTP